MRSAVLSRSSRPAVAPRRTAVVKCSFVSAGRSLALGTKCPYQTLGVDYNADDETIKVAFRRKAKQMHPDVSSDPLASLAFMECQHAYQTLLNPEKRAKYDKTLLPRANSQVLSYLNARSAARHGVPIARVPSRAPYNNRPELYSTMLELLQQVKSCAKHLEREILTKDSGLRGITVSTGAVPPCTGGRRVAVDTECGEHECCEPWIFYTSEPVAAVPEPDRRRP